MNLAVAAFVQIVVGIVEKTLPTFVALWRDRQARLAADAKFAADNSAIADAVKSAQQDDQPKP